MNVWIRRAVSATVMTAAMLLGGAGSAYADCADFLAPSDVAIGDTFVVNVVQVIQQHQDNDTTHYVIDRDDYVIDGDDYDGDDIDVDRYDDDDDDIDDDD